MSKYFYSCDWGTTNLRLRLVDASTGVVLSAVETDQGLARVFSAWKLSDRERFSFYCDILQNCISKLKTSIEVPSGNTPIIVSGMASSDMGMIELPYAELPVGIDGTGLIIQLFQPSDDFAYPLKLISGISSKTDIMRGEEVQVIGACRNKSVSDELFILPGTHSKHVWTHSNNITDVKTYMTGELFHLLSVNSILSNSIDLTEDLNIPGWESFFEEGVMQSVRDGVFGNLFDLRFAHIFNKRTAQQNRYYLNGLLIGGELKSIMQHSVTEVILVSNELQKKYFLTALGLLKINVNKRWISSETATVNGHQLIFEKQFSVGL